MKFPQIGLGQSFRWRGETYRKTGPVTAQPLAGGGQQMIPRSAVVEPVDVAAPADKKKVSSISIAAVRAALDEMLDELTRHAQGLGEDERASLLAALDEGRRQFERRLDPDRS